MIDWEKYFDQVFCIHYLGSKCRRDGITRELGRVGIIDSGLFSWCFTTEEPWERFIAERCNRFAGDSESQRKYVNLGLAIGRIFRISLALGYKRILVLEDDIRFLKNLDLISKSLDMMPKWDIVQLDKFVPRYDTTASQYRQIVESRNIDGCFGFFDGGRDYFTSGACFSVNREGMTALIDCLNKVGPRPVDILFQDAGVRRAVIDKNIAVQVQFKDALNIVNLKSGNTNHKGYAMQGVVYSDYNVPNGYDYDKQCAEYDI